MQVRNIVDLILLGLGVLCCLVFVEFFLVKNIFLDALDIEKSR